MGVKLYTQDPLLRKVISRGPPKTKEVKAKGTKAKEHRHRIWAIDFDGTLCKNAYPNIGEPNQELIEILILCRLQGIKLVLWTSRTGIALGEAVDWCQSKGLIFDAVNENLPEMIELYGEDTRKICADLYIDDRAFPYWGTGKMGDPCRLLEKV